MEEIFKLMQSQGYHYFEGMANTSRNYMSVFFSKLHKGRGDSMEVTKKGGAWEVTAFLGKNILRAKKETLQKTLNFINAVTDEKE